MDARMREDRRRQTSQQRSRPAKTQRIYFLASGLGECTEVQPDTPLELCIEATDLHGKVVPWLCDQWWINAHCLFKDRLVTAVILPTPGALLDPFIIHQFEMVRRIAPKWRIIGYAPLADVHREPDAQPWLNTPYDEIRFCDDGSAPAGDGLERAAQIASQAAIAPIGDAHRTRIRVAQLRADYQLPSGPALRSPVHPPEPLHLDQTTLVQST